MSVTNTRFQGLRKSKEIVALMDAIDRTDACQDLGLSDDDIGKIAFYLLWYQHDLSETKRDRHDFQRKNQLRKITATRSSVKDAAERIWSLLQDPALRNPFVMAYKMRSDMRSGRLNDSDEDDGYYNAYATLGQTCDILNSLHDVLGELEIQEIPGNPDHSRFNKASLVNFIASTLAPYIDENKSLQADYICDFLKLIDINIKHKTILQYLS